MKIINLSNSKRCRIAEQMLASCEFKNESVRRIIILPVPSFRDGEHISGTETPIDELRALVDKGDLVVGYRLPATLYTDILERGALALDLERDESYIFKNNELTSHAALGYILSERGRDISEMRVGVIGYGRLGASLIRLLLFLGADVVVLSGSPEKREALAREGIVCLDYGEMDGTPFDVLINTAPARLLDAAPDAPLFLDLASGDLYSELGAIFLPSLPEKRYPISAGKAYAKAVIDYYNLH